MLYAQIETFSNLLILWSKTSFISLKNEPLFQLKILITITQFFIILGVGHHFLTPFWIIKWMLQPLTTNGMNTILEIKNSLCTCTPCSVKGKENYRRVREVTRIFALSFLSVREWRRHSRLQNKNKSPRLSTVSHYLSKQSKELQYNSFYMSNLSH